MSSRAVASASVSASASASASDAVMEFGPGPTEIHNKAAMRTRSKSRKYSINHSAPSSKVVIVVKSVENEDDDNDMVYESDSEHHPSETPRVSSRVSLIPVLHAAPVALRTENESLVPNIVETLRSKIQDAGTEPMVFGLRADLEQNKQSHTLQPILRRMSTKLRKLEEVTDSLRINEVQRRSSVNVMSTVEHSVVHSPRSVRDQLRSPSWRQQCGVM